jgi:hypothetical protein
MVRVPREHRYWLRRHAFETETPMAEIIRRLIRDYIAAHPGHQ